MTSDYPFIVTALFPPAQTHKLGVSLYCALTFVLPINVGRARLAEQTGQYSGSHDCRH